MKENRYPVFDDGRVVFRYEVIPKRSPFEVEILCPLRSRKHAGQEMIPEQHRHKGL